MNTVKLLKCKCCQIWVLPDLSVASDSHLFLSASMQEVETVNEPVLKSGQMLDGQGWSVKLFWDSLLQAMGLLLCRRIALYMRLPNVNKMSILEIKKCNFSFNSFPEWSKVLQENI